MAKPSLPPPDRRRAFLVVLDSVGCGGAPDAADFGDEGANTLGHIAQACAAGRAEIGRSGPLRVPTLDALGLGAAMRLSAGPAAAPGLDAQPRGLWGAATEISRGKDTPSGHWELAGVPVPWDWHYFPDTDPAFPPALMARVAELAGTGGTLANTHASGMPVIERFGEEHMRSGWPICYTSADSVFQIAAHEETFGLQRLLKLCADLAPELHAMKVGRVIARPFVGDPQTGFTRTGNRRDFAIAPPAPTICDRVHDAGREVHAVGKIGDIFSGRGITRVHKMPSAGASALASGVGKGDAALMAALHELADTAPPGSLTFANFVEFDTNYGHQRDVAGYARALEWADERIAALIRRLRPGDLLIVTADHGNDPTWAGSDHTRERVPVLVHGAGAGRIGHCGFVDVGASVLDWLGVPPGPEGESFL